MVTKTNTPKVPGRITTKFMGVFTLAKYNGKPSIHTTQKSAKDDAFFRGLKGYFTEVVDLKDGRWAVYVKKEKYVD
jgi:hypothetical protein